MRENDTSPKQTLSHEVMLGRLTQSDEMREFFIEMWKQNPALAKQGGSKVQNLMSSSPAALPSGRALRDQRGVSLIELIIFIVIIGTALIGILAVMNQTTAHSADPLVRKQALAIAESLLEEVELMQFTFCDPNDANASSAVGAADCTAGMDQDNGGGALGPIPATEAREIVGSTAPPFDNVADYAGYTTNPATDIVGTTYPGYSATVTMVREGAALMGVAAGAALRITVTVTAPGGEQVVLDGYRTRFSPRTQ